MKKVKHNKLIPAIFQKNKHKSNNYWLENNASIAKDLLKVSEKQQNEIKKTVVEFGASIGANATIICGVKIGKSSMIAAGSVVTRNVGDNELVAGNPAILKKKIKNDQYINYWSWVYGAKPFKSFVVYII